MEEREEGFSENEGGEVIGGVGVVPEKFSMEECGSEGGGNSDGTTEGGGEDLEEVDLGVDSGTLFKDVTAETGGISGVVGAVFRGSEKDHLDKGRVY